MSAGLVDLQLRINTNTLTAAQQAALSLALSTIIPIFPLPDATSDTQGDEPSAREWIAALYSIQALGGGGTPVIIVGTTIVSGGAALTAIDVTSLANGTPAVVESFGADFSLQPKGALAVDGTTVLATNDPLRVWLRGVSLVTETALAQATWIVDPIAGNDENTGLSLAAALKTGNEIIRRWGTRTPRLTTAVTIRWNSSAPASDSFVIESIVTGAGSLLLTNNGLIPTTTTTIAAFTPKNRAAATLNTITAAGIASWAGLVGALVHDTTKGATFFVDADLGAGIAQITEPMATASVLSLFGCSAQAIANGDAIQIFATLPTVFLPNLRSQTVSGTIGGLAVQALTVTSDIITRTSSVVCGECKFGATSIVVGDAVSNFDTPVYNSCRFAAFSGSSAYQGPGSLTGGSIQGAGSQFEGFCFIDGDCVIALRIHPRNCNMLLGSVYFGERFEDQDGPSNYTLQSSVFGPAGGPVFWGPNALNIAGGSHLNIANGTAAAALLVVGGLQLDGLATGFTFNPATGAFSAGAVALTPAALDAAVAFQNPTTQSNMRVGI